MAEQEVQIKIGGMSCGHCVKSVSDALSALDGVHVEEVEIGSARLLVDPQVASNRSLESAVDEIGFEPLEITPK